MATLRGLAEGGKKEEVRADVLPRLHQVWMLCGMWHVLV